MRKLGLVYQAQGNTRVRIYLESVKSFTLSSGRGVFTIYRVAFFPPASSGKNAFLIHWSFCGGFLFTGRSAEGTYPNARSAGYNAVGETVNRQLLSSSICVFCFLPIHSGLQWTYQPGSHRKKVTQDFPSTFYIYKGKNKMRDFTSSSEHGPTIYICRSVYFSGWRLRLTRPPFFVSAVRPSFVRADGSLWAPSSTHLSSTVCEWNRKTPHMAQTRYMRDSDTSKYIYIYIYLPNVIWYLSNTVDHLTGLGKICSCHSLTLFLSVFRIGERREDP